MKIMAQEKQFEFASQLPLYYGQMKTHHTPSLAYDAHNGSFIDWQNAAHDKLMELAGPFPPDTDFSPEVLAEEQRNGYVAQKIALNISAWSRINAYLLTPTASTKSDSKSEKMPAVIMMHDHGAHFSIGKEKVIMPIKTDSVTIDDADKWKERCYAGVFIGDELARQGYVVIAIDAPYFGERGAQEGSRYVDQQAIASNLLMMGYSWAGLALHDDIRTLDFLQSLPFVAPQRIGVVGFSYGAYRAWMLAAASRSVAAMASVCWMSDVEELVAPGNNITRGQTAFAMFIPRLNHYLTFQDAAMIAYPTPSIFIQGNADKLFTNESVGKAYKTIEKVHSDNRLMPDDKLVLITDDEGHTFSKARQNTVWDFLNKCLNFNQK